MSINLTLGVITTFSVETVPITYLDFQIIPSSSCNTQAFPQSSNTLFQHSCNSSWHFGCRIIDTEKSMNPNSPLSQDINSPSYKIKVLVVDDHAIVRQGLRTFIDLQSDMEIVGEGTNGIEAVDLARPTQPDIILLDPVMPEMDGIQATHRIIEYSPDSRITILASFSEEDKVLPAIRAGAHGYILKDIKPTELVQAVRDAYHGKVQLHPEITKKLMSDLFWRDRKREPLTLPGPVRAPLIVPLLHSCSELSWSMV